jgi:hypothetical protein
MVSGLRPCDPEPDLRQSNLLWLIELTPTLIGLPGQEVVIVLLHKSSRIIDRL